MIFVKNTNQRKPAVLCTFILTCLVFWVSPTWGDEEAVAARKIISKWSDAVIKVQLTIEQRMVMAGRQMSKSENKLEVGATIIDQAGLTVISLASTDPTGLFSKMFQGGEEDSFKFEMNSEIKNIKMILADGNEVPAKIVLRDKDLDLAFVYPTEKLPGPVHPIDLSESANPEILDQIVILERLGKTAGRIHSVSLSRIKAIVKKPRTVYVPGTVAMSGDSGTPVFTLDGKLVGIYLLGVIKSKVSNIGMGNMMSGMEGLGIIPGILPAEAIVEVAKQASEIIAEEKDEEKDEKKDEKIGN